MSNESFRCSKCEELYSGVPCNDKGECTSCARFFEKGEQESGSDNMCNVSFLDNIIWWSMDKIPYFLVFFVGFVVGAVLF